MKSLAPINRFKDLNDNSEGFILRHDIDFDLVLAEKMATIEYENDIHSTYFILVGCETYNILSSANREILFNILKLGHEIGLHFDPTFYPNDIEEGFMKDHPTVRTYMMFVKEYLNITIQQYFLI